MKTSLWLKKALALCFGVTALVAAHAQQYPTRPIKIVVGFSPGGSTDAIARYYALKLSDELKTPVVIDNKPGAGQVLAVKTLQAAAPDGYTLYLGTGSSLSQGPGVRNDLPFDPLKDFLLVGMMVTAPGVIVASPSLPVRNIRELVTYSAANPDKLNYGSSGIGSSSHLQMEYLAKVSGIKMTHIPFKADAEIMAAMAGGSVQLGMATVQAGLAAISSGKAKALAVTGTRRLKSLPEVPSLSETDMKELDGIDPYSYYGLAAPLGTPPAIVARLNEAVNKVSASADVVTHVREKLYAEPGRGTPDAFRKFIEADTQKWKSFAKHVKVTP